MLRFWKWKWIWRSVFALMIVVPCLLLAGRTYYRNAGANKLFDHIDKLDRDDPGWRLADVEAKYNAELPADDENAMVVAMNVCGKLGRTYETKRFAFKDVEKQPTNALYRDKDAKALRGLLQGYPAEAAEAKSIRTLTKEAGVPVRFAANPMALRMKEVQDVRGVQGFLQLLVHQALLDGKPDPAMEYVQAMSRMPRAIGKHPTLIGLLVRIAMGSIACGSTERTLAMGEPKEAALAELQASLTYEAEQVKWTRTLRAERGTFHRMIEGFDSGEFDRSALGGTAKGGLQSAGEMWLLRTNIHRDSLFGLTMFEKLLVASEKTYAEQKRAIMEVEDELKTDPYRHVLSSILLPSLTHVADASLRSTGQLRAVSVGIAVERYRLKFGKWPATLADIPKDILPAVPNDPFTDKPIQYKHLPDGVTVYTIGSDGDDDGGPIRDLQDYPNTMKRDWGIKLYHPELRRQPAPPPEPGDVTLEPDLLDEPNP